MQDNVEPASNGVFGRILPRLQTEAVTQEMRWLPVVEGLVAIENRREQSREDIGKEETVECGDGEDLELRLLLRVSPVIGIVLFSFAMDLTL